LRYQLGPHQLRGRLLLLGQLTRLVEFAEIAHGRHAPGQLAAQCSSIMHAGVGGQRLLGGHGIQPGAARVCGHQQGLLRRLQRGLLQLPALPAAAPGQGEQIDQAKAQLALDLALTAVAKPAQGQARVGQGDGLHPLGIGNAQLRQLEL